MYKDKQKQVSWRRSWFKKRMVENAQKSVDYLRTHPCVDCGESDPIVLDFDHTNKSEKLDNVSTLIARSRSWSIIENEISKCEVRCSNCHRRKTFGHLQKFKFDNAVEHELPIGL